MRDPLPQDNEPRVELPPQAELDSPLIAEGLRGRGRDVVCAAEAAWVAGDDEQLIVLCVTEERALITNDVGDFRVLVRRWQLEGGSTTA